MDKYEAYEQMKTIADFMKTTSWGEALQMATDALLEKIQREEDSCESCKVGEIK